MKKEFAKYVSLSVMGILGTSCYILADTYFISKGAGSNGLAALNIAIPVFNVMQAIGMMAGIGAATRFSLTKSKEMFTQAIYLIAFTALIFVLIGNLWTGQLAELLGADSQTMANTALYLQVLMSFAPLFLLNNVVLAFVRNDGKPGLVMAATLLGSLSNIILDYVFIFPMKMGMFGAALATGISPGVSLLIMFKHFAKKENTFRMYPIYPNCSSIVTICSLGLSSFITELANGIVVLVFNMIILKLSGNIGVAAYGVVANIAIVVVALFTGLSQGMQPLLSREYGAGNLRNVVQTYRLGVVTSLLIASGIYGIVYCFTDPIICLFNSENDFLLAQIAGPGIRLYFLAFFFAGINIIKSGYFSAIGSPAKGFWIAMLRGILLILPIAFLLSAAWGMTGVWLTLAVTDALAWLLSIRMKKSFVPLL